MIQTRVDKQHIGNQNNYFDPDFNNIKCDIEHVNKFETFINDLKIGECLQ